MGRKRGGRERGEEDEKESELRSPNFISQSTRNATSCSDLVEAIVVFAMLLLWVLLMMIKSVEILA